MTAPHRRRLARSCGVAALTAALLGLGAGSAQAHDELLESSPSVDEHLDTTPTQVMLRFSDEILNVGPKVIVADDAGATWTAGEPVLEGATVLVPLVADVPDGRYEVRWRVVSSDGHPITGLIPFTVGDPGPAPDQPDDDASAAAGPAPAPDASSEATAAGHQGSSWRPFVVGGVGAVAAAGIFFWAVTARGSRRARADQATPGPDAPAL